MPNNNGPRRTKRLIPHFYSVALEIPGMSRPVMCLVTAFSRREACGRRAGCSPASRFVSCRLGADAAIASGVAAHAYRRRHHVDTTRESEESVSCADFARSSAATWACSSVAAKNDQLRIRSSES